MHIMRKNTLVRVAVAAFFAMPFGGNLAAQEDLSKYQKVLIQTVGEDATSFFENVYFYDRHNALVRTINIWNGGCCQAPLIEEHRRDGDRFELVRSYTIPEKPESFARHLLCTADVEASVLEPSHAAVAGYSIDEVETELAGEDAVLFDGCAQK